VSEQVEVGEVFRVGGAGGGTGGHILPGLETARELARRGHGVTLWLSGRGIESAVISDWTGGVVRVSAAGLPSGMSLRAVVAGVRLCGAVCGSLVQMLRRGRPDVLLAMGSYSSFGPVCAARLLGVPVVLHEANAVPGKANGLLSRVAAAVGVAFPEAADGLHCRRVEVTGMPARAADFAGVAAARAERMVRQKRMTVLVMGGSQGAQAINSCVAGVAGDLAACGVQLIHLTGPKEIDRVQGLYGEAVRGHELIGYCDDMAAVYRRADLAICRSGASSCAELAICGIPALLVPHPTSVRQHQQRNAAFYAAAGAAQVCEQERLDAPFLMDFIGDMAGAPARLSVMGGAALGLAVTDGAQRLAALVEAVASGRNADV
jgi:UDP-N-acetylglucosamine--N-acetylmuramyl-(pentapeptide) pyrophosphoryl-undecaprenol N-acetylglucosamine transferase